MRPRVLKRGFAASIAALLAIGLGAGPAAASSVSLNGNLDDLTLPGASKELTDVEFLELGSGNVSGWLNQSVYDLGSSWLYEFEVTPASLAGDPSFDKFGSRHALENAVTGAGWSFGDVADAGGSGDDSDFLVQFNAGELEWLAQDGWNWKAFDSIRFFFTSNLGPGPLDSYTLIDGVEAHATAYTVVPSPGAAGAGVALMVGLLLKRRRQTAEAIV